MTTDFDFLLDLLTIEIFTYKGAGSYGGKLSFLNDDGTPNNMDTGLFENSLVQAGSYDGSKIAFSAKSITILDITTRQKKDLTGSDDIRQMAWSPDGNYLAYIEEQGTAVSLSVVDIRNNDVRPIDKMFLQKDYAYVEFMGWVVP